MASNDDRQCTCGVYSSRRDKPGPWHNRMMGCPLWAPQASDEVRKEFYARKETPDA